MGNADTKLNFRKAVIQLTTKTEPVEVDDDSFWDQFWSDSVNTVQDVFALIPSAEIRALREESPSNMATLCYKAVEKIVQAADASCRTHKDQVQVLNSIRLLTRLIPYMFEDPDWRNFFWSSTTSPSGQQPKSDDSGRSDDPDQQTMMLGKLVLNAVCDLMFCPEFTVAPNKNAARDEVDDLSSLDSCEYIWASGVGFAHAPANSQAYDLRRREILRFLETCFSQTLYSSGTDINREEADGIRNKWVAYFTSCDNRHALPIFTSLLNTVCGYDPSGILPYNHLLFNDSKEETVEVALQVLIITLDLDNTTTGTSGTTSCGSGDDEDPETPDNLFLNYLSRIHREEDFSFILKGVTRLLMNPLEHTYLPHSQRKVQFHQELLIFFWKFCEHNRKFLFYVLKSSDVLDILTPILHHLNDARADQSRVGLMHIGVFILLLLSGERNFGVRLNKPYTATIPMDIPVFTGTHADLLIIVFHKIITTGHQRLQPLFDCLLTILCNISPYIKSMSMIAACKLLHLLEAFSTPWFLLSSPNNHHLVFFLLEMFNNIIQYQFDGNSNLVYTIIRKRQVLHTLANLPTDCGSINKMLARKSNRKQRNEGTSGERMTSLPVSTPKSDDGKKNEDGLFRNPSGSGMSGSGGEKGMFRASIMEMPTIEKLTERESAHPSQRQLDNLTKSGPSGALFSSGTIQTTAGEVKGVPPLSLSTDSPPKKAEDVPEVPAKRKNSINHPFVALPSVIESRGQVSGDDVTTEHPVPAPSVPADGVPEEEWVPTQEWVKSWKTKLPLQTIMRLLQVLVPQVEKICIDKGLTDESEIIRFLQHGTLVGLLPVPHPILIRKYQPNPGTAMWFKTYMWGVIYLRNTDPPIWYDTDVKLFEIQRI